MVNGVVVDSSRNVTATLLLGYNGSFGAFSVAAMDKFRSERGHDAMRVLRGCGDDWTQTHAHRLLVLETVNSFFIFVGGGILISRLLSIVII